MINILLFVAEQSKRYYPASEIPEMMATFLPRLTKDVRHVCTPRRTHADKPVVRSHNDASHGILPTADTYSPISSRPVQDLGGVQFVCHR